MNRCWKDTSKVKGNSEHGKQLFDSHCQHCHGEDGAGGKGTGVTFSRKRDLQIIAPALNNSGFLASASDVMIRDTIIFGREGTPMTSMMVAGLFEYNFGDSEILMFIMMASALPYALRREQKNGWPTRSAASAP